jgi:SAM-dependent methyltransferase
VKAFYVSTTDTMKLGTGCVQVHAADVDEARRLAFEYMPDGRWSFMYSSLSELHPVDRVLQGVITKTTGLVTEAAEHRPVYLQSLRGIFALGMMRDIVPPVPPIDGLPIINVGCGNKCFDWAVNLDYPEWDANKEPLPFGDESIGGIIAFHFLEHVDRPIDMLYEFQRVLAPGAPATIVVPYYSSSLQAHDLTHKHAFCEDTWQTTFSTAYYTKDRELPWRLAVGTNVIMGVVERNLCLVTQLLKTA